MLTIGYVVVVVAVAEGKGLSLKMLGFRETKVTS